MAPRLEAALFSEAEQASAEFGTLRRSPHLMSANRSVASTGRYVEVFVRRLGSLEDEGTLFPAGEALGRPESYPGRSMVNRESGGCIRGACPRKATSAHSALPSAGMKPPQSNTKYANTVCAARKRVPAVQRAACRRMVMKQPCPAARGRADGCCHRTRTLGVISPTHAGPALDRGTVLLQTGHAAAGA